MVIRGDENVYPRESEEFLDGHPKIADVQVSAGWLAAVAGRPLPEHVPEGH